MSMEDRLLTAAMAAYKRSCQIAEDRDEPLKRWDQLHPDAQKEWVLIVGAAIAAWRKAS